MKLLWIFPSFEIGGAQRRFASLAARLPEGYSHTVLSMSGADDAKALVPESVDLRILPGGVAKSLPPQTILRMKRVLRAESPDLALTSNWGSIEWLLANRLGPNLPHIHFEDGFGPDEAHTRKRRRDLTRRALFSSWGAPRGGQAFVAPSHGLKRLFAKTWRAPPRRIHLVPNGVEVDMFAAAAQARRPVVGRPPVIGSVGALRPEKRFDRLLRMFAGLRAAMDARLLLVGDGPEMESLRVLAAELGIANAVAFTGSRADIPEQLARMDIYALTSDTEQMPISLIEAMASGLPAVATDVGDVALTLSDANRPYVCAPTDEKGLIAAACALATDRVAARRVASANAERAAARYDVQVMAARFHKLFQETTSM